MAAYNVERGEWLATISWHWTYIGAKSFAREMNRISDLANVIGTTKIGYLPRYVPKPPRPIPDAEDCWSGNWDGEIR